MATLTPWPAAQVDARRRLLRHAPLVSPQRGCVVEHTLPHGAVEASVGTIRQLGLATRSASTPCRARQLGLAMLAERLLSPSSTLGTTRRWHTTTWAEAWGGATADEDALDDAMDGLLARQGRSERTLAQRPLTRGAHGLYAVTRSSDEGRPCPVAPCGSTRDQKRGKPRMVYGVLTERDGRPVAVEASRGHPADPSTLPDHVAQLRTRFGLHQVVLVGERGTLPQTQSDSLQP